MANNSEEQYINSLLSDNSKSDGNFSSDENQYIDSLFQNNDNVFQTPSDYISNIFDKNSIPGSNENFPQKVGNIANFAANVPIGAAQAVYSTGKSLLNPALSASNDLYDKISGWLGNKKTTKASQIPDVNISQSLGLPQNKYSDAGQLIGTLMGGMGKEAAKNLELGGINKIDNTIGEKPSIFLDQNLSKPGYHNDFVHKQYKIRKDISDSNYNNAINKNKNSIPDEFSIKENVLDTDKPLDLGEKGYFSSTDLKLLKEKDPGYFEKLQKEYGDNPNSFNNKLDSSDQNLLNRYTKKLFKKANQNPTIRNLHDLAQKAGEASGRADTFQDRESLSNLEREIKEKYIIPHLKKMDKINGTNTAIPYQNADAYFKKELAPFRATKKLDSISLGYHNLNKNLSSPASKIDLLKEIDKGRTTRSKYNFDMYGNPHPIIPDDHFLTQFQPTLENLISKDARKAWLKKVASDIAKGATGMGAGGIGAYELLKNK